MRRKLCLLLASSSLALVCSVIGSPFAATVVSYNPGTGYAAGYTNTSVIRGQPSTNSDGYPVDPFDPAYETNQLVSIGAGGWLTVAFDHPIVPYPNGNRDFIIFGNSFFDVTNYSAAEDLQATDGAVINDEGQSRVSVSRDGVTFYTLNPALAPTVSDFYPTDGSGNFQIPVNPALGQADFAGLTLADVSLLYNGSAGGASFDTAWAQDTNGNPVSLPDIRYVRVDVTTNRLQIGGFAAVESTILAESFSNNPAADGWQTFGVSNLFNWNPTNRDLQVTWDSSQSNSYLYHPLGTILTAEDNFSLSFDLLLNDANTNGDGTNALQLAIGFVNLSQAENPNFLVGNEDCTNLAEFEFFPAADGYSPSIDGNIQDTNGYYAFAYNDVPWTFGQFYQVTLNYSAGSGELTGQVLLNGQLYAPLPGSGSTGGFYNEGIGDFRVDTIAICSFSDAGSAAIGYPSSIVAHGVIKNLLITGPPPPVNYISGGLTNNAWQVQFWSRTNWNYTLEASTNLQTWSPVGPAVSGLGGQMMLQDTNALQQSRYYKVSAYPQ